MAPYKRTWLERQYLSHVNKRANIINFITDFNNAKREVEMIVETFFGVKVRAMMRP